MNEKKSSKKCGHSRHCEFGAVYTRFPDKPGAGLGLLHGVDR